MEKRESDAARVVGFIGGFGEDMKRRYILPSRVRNPVGRELGSGQGTTHTPSP